MKIFNIKTFIILALLLFNINIAQANESKQASVNFSISLPSYIQITSVTSPVLTVNITDDTGNT